MHNILKWRAFGHVTGSDDFFQKMNRRRDRHQVDSSDSSVTVTQSREAGLGPGAASMKEALKGKR